MGSHAHREYSRRSVHAGVSLCPAGQLPARKESGCFLQFFHDCSVAPGNATAASSGLWFPLWQVGQQGPGPSVSQVGVGPPGLSLQTLRGCGDSEPFATRGRPRPGNSLLSSPGRGPGTLPRLRGAFAGWWLVGGTEDLRGRWPDPRWNVGDTWHQHEVCGW